MKIIKMKLVPHYEDYIGHCQVTYWCKNDEGQKIFYALQENFGIRPVRCTRTYEPQYEIKKWKEDRKIVWELPNGDNQTEKKAREWIKDICVLYDQCFPDYESLMD